MRRTMYRRQISFSKAEYQVKFQHKTRIRRGILTREWDAEGQLAEVSKFHLKVKQIWAGNKNESILLDLLHFLDFPSNIKQI